jgi:photosystem II stability/assembly factor-like uncharacterized protein
MGGGVAWASGTNGTVLRTEDGGYVWQNCTVPPGAEHLDFRGIQGFDANTAIVMSSGKGDLSRLYKTTDGCSSWKLVFTNPDKDGFWDAIYRDDDGLLWLLGDPVDAMFTLFTSRDDGEHWDRWFNKGYRAHSELEGAFAASNSSFAIFGFQPFFGSGGAGGAFIFTMTNGYLCGDCSMDKENPGGIRDTWNKYPVPLGLRTPSSGVFSIAGRRLYPKNPDIAHMWLIAVGGDYAKPNSPSRNAAYSSDAGKHWTLAKTPPHGYRSAVAYDEALKAWITVGPNGTDVSTDDGKNWRRVRPDAALHEEPDADRNWNALSLPFVVGPKGRIGRLDRTSF